MQHRVERIFRLLALIHPPQDIYSAYYACLVKPAIRPSAVEFLDNLLEPKTKATLIPVIEEAFELRPPDIKDDERIILDVALARLDEASDPWLRLIAADLSGRLRIAA